MCVCVTLNRFPYKSLNYCIAKNVGQKWLLKNVTDKDIYLNYMKVTNFNSMAISSYTEDNMRMNKALLLTDS